MCRFRILAALVLAGAVQAADGARELTRSEDVRAHREETRERSSSSSSTSSSSSSSSSSSTSSSSSSPEVTITTSSGEVVPATPQPEKPSIFSRPLPEGARLPWVIVSVEQGWYGVGIDNGTTASAGRGSLGTDFKVGYEIDPFAMTRISGTGRIDQWGVALGYADNPEERQAGELLSLAVQRFTPDDGGWWQATISWARLRGIATTADALGDKQREEVDSRWRTIAIERRTYPLLVWGVQYEELHMPSAYSLDDPDGQVIAIFDDSTRWRTVSLILGIDNGNAAVVERRNGLRPLIEARVGLGLGAMGYDDGTVKALARSYGYAYDDSGGLVFTASGEVAFGARAGLAWHGAWIEGAFGGRTRVAWMGTGGNDTPEGQQPDYDTLVLNSSLTTWTYGVFARLTAAF